MLVVFPSQKGFCFGFQGLAGAQTRGVQERYSQRFTHQFPRRAELS